jgi:hypothetical protein
MTGGRPPLDPAIPVTLWLLVEIERDKRQSTTRRSVREACERIETHLFERYGKIVDWETIRRQYKNAEKLLRKTTLGATKEATAALAEVRRRRDALGWKIEPLVLLGFNSDDAAVMFSAGPLPGSKAEIAVVKDKLRSLAAQRSEVEERIQELQAEREVLAEIARRGCA